MDKQQCPGHDGVCPFCKSELASHKYLDGFTQIDAMGNPLLNYCCTTCAKNAKHGNKFDAELQEKFR